MDFVPLKPLKANTPTISILQKRKLRLGLLSNLSRDTQAAGCNPRPTYSGATLMASGLSCPLNLTLQRGSHLEASRGHPALNAVGDQHMLMNERMNSRVFTVFTFYPFLLSSLRIMENLRFNEGTRKHFS